MYYLAINGSQQGPFPADQVRAMLAAREIMPDTLIWTEGQADWLPVGQVLAPSPVIASGKTAPSGMFSFLGGVGVTLAVVGAVLLGILVIVGGIIGYAVYVGNGLDKSSKEYVDEAIPAIVTSWAPDELIKRESKAFLKATNDQQLLKLFAAFRRLGKLKSYAGSKGQASINYMPDTGKMISATYLGRATFENGEAEIKVILIQENGQWKIQGFRIDSPVFLK